MQSVSETGATTVLLLAKRGGRPDGRPLYQYRFSRDEFEGMKTGLRSGGIEGLRRDTGAAIFVAYAAEWFRRDRDGGSWDWKRPLAEIGIRYGQDDWRAVLTYGELADIVDRGLRWWRRPTPATGQRLTTVVAEAGFPAAALRNSRAVLSWLQHSVGLIEKGFAPRDAVAAEAWRMQAQSVVQATFEVAVLLCEALADLRAKVRDLSPLAEDPIAVLEASDPTWRSRLPIDLEAGDIVRVIETVIRARLEASAALTATRLLRRDGEVWKPRVRLGLSGDLDASRLPAPVARQLGEMTRARIAPRGALVGFAGAVTALESLHEDEEFDGWRLRPLVDRFDAGLALDADVRLGLLASDGRVLEEFVAEGGEGLWVPVLALDAAGAADPTLVEDWTVIGGASVRTAQEWIGLALAEELVDRLEVDGDLVEFGDIADGRKLVAISGSARCVLDDGLALAWRTRSDQTAAPRLLVLGSILRGPRETVFRGLPRFVLDTGEVRRDVAIQRLSWKGRSGGWRSASQEPPVGRVLIRAADQHGEVVAMTSLIIAPSALELSPDRAGKRLHVRGAGPAGMAANAGKILPVTSEGGVRTIDLSSVEPGRTVELTFAWASPATLTLPNPATRRALLDPKGRLAPRHPKLSLGQLHGWRLLTSEPALICFELTARSGVVRSFTRPTQGEASLIAFIDDLRNLLGSSDALDGALRLSWIGEGDWICEIRRYEREVDLLADGGAVTDGERALLLGIDRIRALDLGDLEAEPLDVDPVRLPASAPIAQTPDGGPWLVYGQTSAGGVVRPSVLLGDPSSRHDDPLTVILRGAQAADREAALIGLMGEDADWSAETLLRWSRLPVLAAAEGVPYTAFDALRLLHRRPAAAVRLLAEASGPEAQRAVLALQRETPLVWVATPIVGWVDAFDRRLKTLEAQLSDAGLEPSIAAHDLLGATSRLLDMAPSLAVHVQAVVLTLIGGPSSQMPGFEALALRLAGLCPPKTDEALVAGVNAFVQRHVDGPPPPQGLGLADRSFRAQPLIARFPAAFSDVIAGPFVAAEAARGTIRLDRATAAACRAAWLFDPDHFDTIAASACR